MNVSMIRSTHSHLTDLADKDEKEEIPEIAYSGQEKKQQKKNGHGHGHSHSHSGGHGHSHGGDASNMNMRGWC